MDDDDSGHPNAFLVNRRAQEQAKFPRFRMVTLNANSWNSLKEYLLVSDASIVCGQEIRLEQKDIIEATIWARTKGWASYWNSSKVTENGGLSAGVVILVRLFCSLGQLMQTRPPLYLIVQSA